MSNIIVLFLVSSIHLVALAHPMQHGFILSRDDSFASHLVAQGHHSWQASVLGELKIQDAGEQAAYELRKASGQQTYFLLQAQSLDLTKLRAGTSLIGHIIESKIGSYEPNNTVVRSATFEIKEVLLSLPNPFFAGNSDHISNNQKPPK